MKIIPNRQWNEYQNLKIQRNFESVRNVEYLKDDIDLPIRSIVAMLALLKCKPIFSCCGFDYDGQPIHKSHEYGCVYFMMEANQYTYDLVNKLTEMKVALKLNKDGNTSWMYWEHKNVMFLRSSFTVGHKKVNCPWVSSRECIHYSEIASFKINELETTLWLFKDSFLDEIILLDTNEKYKTLFRSWQYPSLKPWKITLKEIFI